MLLKKSVAVFAVLTSLALTSCGNNINDLDYILDKDEFILGFTDFPPMGFTDRGVDSGWKNLYANRRIDRDILDDAQSCFPSL